MNQLPGDKTEACSMGAWWCNTPHYVLVKSYRWMARGEEWSDEEGGRQERWRKGAEDVTVKDMGRNRKGRKKMELKRDYEFNIHESLADEVPGRIDMIPQTKVEGHDTKQRGLWERWLSCNALNRVAHSLRCGLLQDCLASPLCSPYNAQIKNIHLIGALEK